MNTTVNVSVQKGALADGYSVVVRVARALSVDGRQVSALLEVVVIPTDRKHPAFMKFSNCAGRQAETRIEGFKFNADQVSLTGLTDSTVNPQTHDVDAAAGLVARVSVAPRFKSKDGPEHFIPVSIALRPGWDA